MLIRILVAIIRFLFRLLARVEVVGTENLPRSGGIIVAVNHLAALDPPLAYMVIWPVRKDMTALAAKKHQKNVLYSFVINAAGGIWLNRDEPDTRALREAREHLQKGGVLGIAPEGTRSKTGGLISGKTGAAYMADKAGVPIVPVGINGTYRVVSRVLLLQRPRITVRFGRPFSLPPVERKTRECDLERNTEEIMCRIAALLEPQYRGVYADHPRLKELLNGQNN